MTARSKVLSYTILAMALVLIGLCAYSVKKTQHDAERFFQAAQDLEIAQTTAKDILRLAESSQGRSDNFDPCLSGGANCVGNVIFTNPWLRRLHLAPQTFFVCRFEIRDYKLRSRWFEMTYSGVGAFLFEGSSTQTVPNEVQHKPQERYFKISGGHPAGYLGVMITHEAPVDLRKLAYRFNFSCLSRLGGCRDYEQMLPVLARKDLYWGEDPWKHEVKVDSLTFRAPLPLLFNNRRASSEEFLGNLGRP